MTAIRQHRRWVIQVPVIDILWGADQGSCSGLAVTATASRGKIYWHEQRHHPGNDDRSVRIEARLGALTDSWPSRPDWWTQIHWINPDVLLSRVSRHSQSWQWHRWVTGSQHGCSGSVSQEAHVAKNWKLNQVCGVKEMNAWIWLQQVESTRILWFTSIEERFQWL